MHASRWRRGAVGAVALVAVPLVGLGPEPGGVGLYADGVRLDARGIPRSVAPTGSDVVPPPLAGGGGLSAAGSSTAQRWGPMLTRARADLDALVLDAARTGDEASHGAVLAGPSAQWRYVWPRDAAFVAAALAVDGDHERALQVLEHTDRLRGGAIQWQARYLPDGSGDVPDARGIQSDGAGWLAWAAGVWGAQAPPNQRDDGLRRLHPLLTASVVAAAATVDPASGLPAPGPDYWETATSEPLLGSAAPLLAGTTAASALLAELGDDETAALATATAGHLYRGVVQRFAPRGYPRRVSGRVRDCAVAFLRPPFRSSDGAVLPGVDRAYDAALLELARPNGGLAPGAGWKADGVSWTPETAVFALTAASTGDTGTARRLMDWLDGHRTARGSLPEKVNHQGRPAAVAPLAWTAATVLLTAAVLDGTDVTPPAGAAAEVRR